MKITKARLQQIIKEERDAYLPQMGAGISPEEGAAELRADIKELMGSGLFSKADPKDKKNAARRIFRALKKTNFYGGENTFYEEILDDALGGYGSDLQQRLADAAGAPVDSWGEALSAWASGEEDFMKWADPDYEDEDIGYMQENKMKLSKARLRQIIKEELQREGIFDLFKRKSKASSRWWLHPEMPTDVKQLPLGGSPREYRDIVKQTIDFIDALDPKAMFFKPYDYSWKKLNVPKSLDRATIPTAAELRAAVPNPANPNEASWDIWSAEAREMLGNRDPELSRKVYEYLASLGNYNRLAKQVQKYRLRRIHSDKKLIKAAWYNLRAYYKTNRAEVENVKKGIEKLLNGEVPQEVIDAFKLAVLRGSWTVTPGAGLSNERVPSMEDVYRTLLDLTDPKRSSKIDAELDADTGYYYRPKSYDR